MRESAYDRGRRLLTEGRVVVRRASDVHVAAEVRGDTGVVRLVTGDPTGYTCNCPAVRTCAHVVAVSLVTLLPLLSEGP